MDKTAEQSDGVRTTLMAIGSADLGETDVPTRILVVPWGRVASSKGAFTVDGESAADVVAAFNTGGNDLPIDYEHQTLGGEFTSPDGRAPAAGWIKSLEIADGQGIYAMVEWTERGKAVLAAKEYRYLSPVALVDRETMRMVALHSAALTNKPAIPALRPIVNADRPESANDGAPIELTVAASAVEQLRTHLGIDGSAAADDVLSCASRRLGELQERVCREEASALVDDAIRAGKCTESQRAWAESLALRDPAGFASWQQCAPVVMHTGRLEAPGVAPQGNRRIQSVANRARAEYRRHTELHALTAEDAYVKLALREAGFDDHE